MVNVYSQTAFGPSARVTYASHSAQVIYVCEHASNYIPAQLKKLGTSFEIESSHVAWDIGALGVARCLSQHLAGPLVEGMISRLVYDCNRPPNAADAVPQRSEIFDIPGNQGLTVPQRQARVDGVYTPFAQTLEDEIASRFDALKLMVTVHSFTPIYKGVKREVDFGILHGRDSRFAELMMDCQPRDCGYVVRLNEPYSAQDGVAHTLDLHDIPSVMLEVRNDLIGCYDTQDKIAKFLAPWIEKTLKCFLEQECK